MEWKRVLVILERFESMSITTIRELKQHYQQIQQLEYAQDFENAAIEKNNAQQLLDQLLTGLQQILNVRNEISFDLHKLFDNRIESIQQQIQTIINTFEILLKKNQISNTSTSHENKKVTDNIFDDCFSYKELNKDSSIYEKQLITQTQNDCNNGKLRMQLEQAKMNSEASQKLAEEIDVLNQVMTDLSQLVHSQHDMVDSIEEHIERSNLQVQSGHQQLKKAVVAKNSRYSFLAAIFGSIAVGGPVGVAAGSAVAGVTAAIGGAFAGLYSNRVIKKQILKETTKE